MGPPLTQEVKNVIYQVHTFFRERKEDKQSMEFKFDMNINNLVAEATGVSARSVMRVVAEGNSNQLTLGEIKFSPPKKPKEKKKRINVDDSQKALIRKKINHYYITNKRIPSIPKLNTILKEDGVINCSCSHLRRLLHSMGYQLKKPKRSDVANFKQSDVNERPILLKSEAGI